MPRYVVETDFGRISEEEMQEFAVRGKMLEAEHFPDINWEGSRVCTGADGSIKSFCVYEAPGSDRLQQHTDIVKAGLVCRMFEIVGEIDPEDIRI
jgi:hypothetical protein